MYSLQISLLFHILGIGMILTTILGGWIVDAKYRKASDWGTKLILLGVLRPIGLLSPISVLVMLLTGATNMHLVGLGLFSAAWLTLKLVFFVLMVISGVLSGIKGTRRTKLVTQFAAGNPPANGETALRSLDNQQRVFFIVQMVLLLIIISLSLIRPSA